MRNRLLSRWVANAAVAGLVLAPAGLVLAPAEAVFGQPSATVAGRVMDSAGSGLVGVEVAVAGTSLRTLTNERGDFHIRDVALGEQVIRARRIGFHLAEMRWVVSEGRHPPLRIELAPLVQMLAPVTVRRRSGGYSGRLAEYYERLERGTGAYFITRNEIDRANARTVAQLLRTVPGVTLLRGNAGATMVRLRGRACRPAVWIDGVALSAGDVDLESFHASSIHGIEVYLGFSTPPMRYLSLREGSNCGTILLWSRSRDTESSAPNPALAKRLADRVATSDVLTANQVDKRAVLADEGRLLELAYPPDIVAAKSSDYVIAEFVVGVDGTVEYETLGTLSAPHPALARVLREALSGLRYTPATLAGRPVRQLVHQRFDFVQPVATP